MTSTHLKTHSEVQCCLYCNYSPDYSSLVYSISVSGKPGFPLTDIYKDVFSKRRCSSVKLKYCTKMWSVQIKKNVTWFEVVTVNGFLKKIIYLQNATNVFIHTKLSKYLQKYHKWKQTFKCWYRRFAQINNVVYLNLHSPNNCKY